MEHKYNSPISQGAWGGYVVGVACPLGGAACYRRCAARGSEKGQWCLALNSTELSTELGGGTN